MKFDFLGELVGFILVRGVFNPLTFIALRLTILIVGRRVNIMKPKSMRPKMENAAMIRTQIYEYLSKTGDFGGDTAGIEGGFVILTKGGIKGVGGGDPGKGG